MYFQFGGRNCSICKSPGTTKATCPCNLYAINPNPAKHPKCKVVKQPPKLSKQIPKSPVIKNLQDTEHKSPKTKSPEHKSPKTKSPKKATLTGDKNIDNQIMMKMDPDTLFNFCTNIIECNDEKFWESYVKQFQVHEPESSYRKLSISKTNPNLSWKTLFMESYKLFKMAYKFYAYRAMIKLPAGQKYVTLDEISSYIDYLIKNNYLDVLHPYYDDPIATIGSLIKYQGVKHAVPEIMDMFYRTRYTYSSAFPYIFASTTPEGADYMFSLGYRPDNSIITNMTDNLPLIKHMVSLGYVPEPRALRLAILNQNLDTIKYLIEELGMVPQTS